MLQNGSKVTLKPKLIDTRYVWNISQVQLLTQRPDHQRGNPVVKWAMAVLIKAVLTFGFSLVIENESGMKQEGEKTLKL